MRKSIITLISFLFFIIITSNQAFSSTVTHKVKQGDNLYNIAKKYHITVDKLNALNNLRSNKLKLGQQLIVSKEKGVPPSKTIKEAKKVQTGVSVAENDGEFIEYRTKKGDTLEKIAKRFNIDKDEVLEANNLSNKKISPGKIILIPKVIEDKEEEFVTLTNQPLNIWKSSEEKYMLVKVAKSFMGAPYKYGGESVRGLDCSAFVKKIYDIFDVQLPRSARDQFKTGLPISKDELAIGDLVFFKIKRYIKYPTHVGIFIGDGNFIHSSSTHNKLGVKIDSLASDFYAKFYVGAVRVKRLSDESAETAKPIENASNNS